VRDGAVDAVLELRIDAQPQAAGGSLDQTSRGQPSVIG
jgi:hypothetical protein